MKLLENTTEPEPDEKQAERKAERNIVPKQRNHPTLLHEKAGTRKGVVA